MYSYIKGILTDAETGCIVVEAAGVGYEICVPASVAAELPPVGSELKVYTHFSVREDGQTLYGFLTGEDREMFRKLITVNGIGPRGALSILSILRPDDLRLAIATGDAKSISQAPGIGKKTAERVILDLKDVFAKDISGNTDPAAGLFPASGETARNQGPVAEAIEALTMLGFSRIEAGRAVGSAYTGEGMNTEDLIRVALKGIRK